MPLIKGTKPGSKSFKENIRTEVHAGRPVKQAVAIAYSESRQKGAKDMEHHKKEHHKKEHHKKEHHKHEASKEMHKHHKEMHKHHARELKHHEKMMHKHHHHAKKK